MSIPPFKERESQHVLALTTAGVAPTKAARKLRAITTQAWMDAISNMGCWGMRAKVVESGGLIAGFRAIDEIEGWLYTLLSLGLLRPSTLLHLVTIRRPDI
jgi:hypothetical protein